MTLGARLREKIMLLRYVPPVRFLSIFTTKIVFDSIFLSSLSRAHKKQHSENNNILIIRTDHLGDFIHFLPSFLHYRQVYPGSHITFVISDAAREFVKDFVDRGLYDNLVVINREAFKLNMEYKRMILKRIMSRSYAHILHPNYSRNYSGEVIARYVYAPSKVGFETDFPSIPLFFIKRNNKYYTRLIKLPKDIILEYTKNNFFIHELGAKNDIEEMPQITLNKPLNTLKDKFKIPGKYCIVFPGAGANYRIWPLDRFAAVCDFLNEKGIMPVIAGSKGERALAEKIRGFAKKPVTIVSGEISLKDLAYLLNDSLFFFGSETGITHLAAALKTPVLCLLGLGHFGRFFPFGDRTLNRIVYDKSLACLDDDWHCARGYIFRPAPCIERILLSDAKIELDNLLQSDIIKRT
jgi:ADP-heptose:LPS heptosyltransferase